MIFRAEQTLKGINEIKDFSERNKICFKTAQILMQRGIDTDEKFSKFVNPTLDDFRDPFLLDGMHDATERIEKAIANNESILIFGDYDVDGISAVTILYKFLKDKVSNLNYFLPNRYVDGYGLTIPSAKKIIELFHPNLIITVDCGITCVDEVDYIKSQGIDIIITDHHEMAEKLPNTIVVDPKVPNQKYGFNGLCGTGVAMKIVETFVGRQNLTEYLPICAIATVSDIVPLLDENRAIVKLGLKLTEKLPEGLKRLVKELKLDEINSSAISFKIAPRLNAAGRMGNAYTALNLYISQDENIIKQSLEKLGEQNSERQKLSQEIYEDCLKIIKENRLYLNRAIVLKSEKWDSGLLGIACARLVDDFYRPVFLFSDVDGELKGSVRSIDAINIHTLLSSCNDKLDTFGGHSMAAGLSLKTKNFDDFCQQVYSYLNTQTTEKDYLPIRKYDVAVKEEDITLEFAKELQLLQPFGCDNPNPLFMISYGNAFVGKLGNFENHLSIGVNKNLKLISFNSGSLADDYRYSETKQTIFELQINQFRGKSYLKGIVKATLFVGFNKSLQNISTGRQLKQLYFDKPSQKQIEFFEEENFSKLADDLLKKPAGTAIVIYDYKTYQKLKSILEKYQLNFYVGNGQSKFEENCVIFALENIDDIKSYSNLVFCDPLMSRGFVNNFEGRVFAVKNKQFSIENLQLSRSYFGIIYNAIREIINKNIPVASELELYSNITKIVPNLKYMSYSQFVSALYTFVEIGVVELNLQFGYKIKYNDTSKVSLENSQFYNKLKLYQKIK